jgi:hypothetical protein
MKLFGNVMEDSLRIKTANSTTIAKEFCRNVVRKLRVRKGRSLVQDLFGNTGCSDDVVLGAT